MQEGSTTMATRKDIILDLQRVVWADLAGRTDDRDQRFASVHLSTKGRAESWPAGHTVRAGQPSGVRARIVSTDASSGDMTWTSTSYGKGG